MAVTVLHRSVEQGRSVYTIDFFGDTVITTVTSDPSAIAEWLEGTTQFLRRRIYRPVVGMGVQWVPGYGYEPAATLQLCVGKRCLIIQLTYCRNVPGILRKFLLNDRYTFVGIWNHSDAGRLARCGHALRFSKLPLDLKNYVETDDGGSLIRASFEKIVEECLGYSGVYLDREISMSDWEAYELDVDQVQQATVDAYCSFLIGRNYGAADFE